MKQHPNDSMKEPYFGYLSAVLEQEIVKADLEAKEQSRQFTDSQIRSTLIKTIKIAKGERPAVPAGSEHEKLLAELIPRILKKREEILTWIVDENGNEPAGDDPNPDQPVPLRDWILVLETLVASIKIRTQMTPGSRGYLDFVHDFVRQMPASVTVKG